jgi:hypothetical protein
VTHRSRLPVRHLLTGPSVPARSRGRRGWVVILLLAACLVFCHGCHGDDVDDELCVTFVQPREQDHQP